MSAQSAVTPLYPALSHAALTIGSLSTQTTFARALTACTAAWTEGSAGSPAPRSANWVMPSCAAILAAVVTNSRLRRVRSIAPGSAAISARANARSAGRLKRASSPPLST